MSSDQTDIFERMRAGGMLRNDDPQMPKVWKIIARTIKLSAALSVSTDIIQIRDRLSEITGSKIDRSTIIFAPFHTNFGKHIRIGKNVFINHACSFLDMGGISIEDNVQIGPRVNLITENHPVDPLKRKDLDLKPVLIKRNAWIGAGATILPGVTVGVNSIVAAGALVNRDVPDNMIVAGVPARIIREIE